MRQHLELREMELLVALARHQHFAKAAEACQISQPAFSMRIRNLEEKIGRSIVRRGNRFLGFTEQGEHLLRRARAILEDVKALEQELGSADGAVTGTLTIGVIPTALAFAAQLCTQLFRVHPGIVTRISSTSSIAIQQGLDAGTLDAGITYDDSLSEDMVRLQHLYDETYVLVVPRSMAPEGRTEIPWKEAADLPMTLLEPGMQNRRILDRMFREVGAVPQVISETNGFVASIIMAQQGLAATVVPAVLSKAMGEFRDTVTLPLVEPELRRAICLATPLRTPGLPAAEALCRIADQASDRQ